MELSRNTNVLIRQYCTLYLNMLFAVINNTTCYLGLHNFIVWKHVSGMVVYTRRSCQIKRDAIKKIKEETNYSICKSNAFFFLFLSIKNSKLCFNFYYFCVFGMTIQKLDSFCCLIL